MASHRRNILVPQLCSPLTLKSFCLHIVSQMLLRLNDCKIGNEFIWLDAEQNPFIGIPPFLTEEIIEALKEPLAKWSQPIRKELLQILFCKRLRAINLSRFLMKEEEVLPILELIDATQSELNSFEVGIESGDFSPLCWLHIPSALSFLKRYIRSLPSLTHLNVSGACDDEMLEAIGLSCPNLIVLIAVSDKITSHGLRNLCMNTRDRSKRCLNLQKITLDRNSFSTDDRLMEGVELLLLTLPQLRVIHWSRILLGTIIVNTIDETKDLPKYHLEELVYDVFVHDSYLPSVIARVCPNLTTLEILNASDEILQKFEHMTHLKNVLIVKTDNLLSFNEGIALFIQRMGHSLEDLNLYSVDDVDFNVIDRYCPNLKRLKCSHSGAFSGAVREFPVFRKLEYVCLESDSDNGLRPNDCIRLLSRCFNLRCLVLNCCRELKEQHLRTILLDNPLEHLQCAHISSANLSINENRPKQRWTSNYRKILRAKRKRA